MKMPYCNLRMSKVVNWIESQLMNCVNKAQLMNVEFQEFQVLIATKN